MDIDLGPACNIASYRDLEWFEDIPAGDCVLAGIPFAIRDAIVLMHGYVEDKRSRFYPDLPECVVVEVGQKATALAFLHTARFQFNAFRWNNNEAIAGEYRIHFEDGGVERLPVTVGGNVRNHGDSSLATLPYEQPALVADGRVLLSACCWENPCPEREIERIEIVSVEDTATSIAPFAITELDAVPWDDKVFLSAADVQIGARTSRMLGWRQQAADQLAAILAEKGLGPEALDDWPVNRSILKLETDDEFFGAIDLERPELAEVREAAARGNRPGHGAASVRRRDRPQPLRDGPHRTVRPVGDPASSQ